MNQYINFLNIVILYKQNKKIRYQHFFTKLIYFMKTIFGLIYINFQKNIYNSKQQIINKKKDLVKGYLKI